MSPFWNGDYYQFDFYALAPLAVGFLIGSLGLITIYRERASGVSLAFALMTTSGALWLMSYGMAFASPSDAVALVWIKISHLGVVSIPSTVYLFTLAIIRQVRKFKSFFWACFAVSTFFSVVIFWSDQFVSGIYHYFWGPYAKYGPMGIFFLIFFFITMALSLSLYWRKYRKATPGMHKNRLKWFLTALGIAYIGSFDFVANFGIACYPFGYIPILIFIGIANFAIGRYRLTDFTPLFAANEILSTMQGAVLLVDLEGYIRVANRAASMLLGYNDSALIGMPISKIASTPFKLGTEEGEATVTDGLMLWRERPVYDYTMEWRTKTGRLADVSVSASPLKDKKGAPAGLVYVAIDITERKRAQELLKKSHDELEQRVKERTEELARSNKELEEFAYMASHDMQEPLRKMASFAELLAERYQGKMDAEADKFIQYITQGAAQMQALIQDLLAYSRAGKQELVLEEVGFGLVLEQTLVNLEKIIREKEAVVTHDPLPTVKANPRLMGVVFQNLIGNGIKFQQDSTPRIHVSARREDKAWIFSVHDNGIGIDPKYVGRLFTMFYRLHTRDEYPGSGIGLAMCQRIVERHGGRIWVESQPGQGTTFYFTLPVREESQKP